MIKQLLVAAGMGLALSSVAFADSPDKSADKAGSSYSGATAASTAAQCDKLAGAEKASCLKQARDSSRGDGSATGATAGSASGKAGTAGSSAQSKSNAPQAKDGAPASSDANSTSKPY
jgi:hypothetical protein